MPTSIGLCSRTQCGHPFPQATGWTRPILDSVLCHDSLRSILRYNSSRLRTTSFSRSPLPTPFCVPSFPFCWEVSGSHRWFPVWGPGFRACDVTRFPSSVLCYRMSHQIVNVISHVIFCDIPSTSGCDKESWCFTNSIRSYVYLAAVSSPMVATVGKHVQRASQWNRRVITVS